MPRVDELLDRLGTARFYSTLDLTKGYWQIPLSPFQRKVSLHTPFGLHQFVTLPFGLFGAPATFQRLMDKILRPHTAYAAAYLDDIIIYSQDWQRHMVHLREAESAEGSGTNGQPKEVCDWAGWRCVIWVSTWVTDRCVPKLIRRQLLRPARDPRPKRR